MERFVKWYRSRSSESSLRRQIDAFAGAGIGLEHPQTRTATILNIDGDQVQLGVTDLIRMLMMRLESITMQWWLDSHTDLVCRFANLQLDCEVQTFYLDGLTKGQDEMVRRILLQYMKRNLNDTLGYVVDLHGATDNVDWDDVIISRNEKVSAFPDELAVPVAALQGLGSIPRCLKVSRIANLYLLSKSTFHN